MIDYKIKESYRNTGLRCFKVSFFDFLENFGERFEDRGQEDRRGIVSWGYYNDDTRLRIFHSRKVLHGVHFLYEGNNPEIDLKELRGYLEEIGLKKTKVITEKLEKEVEIHFQEIETIP